MNVNEALTGLNLTPREAQLYTALLELGQATPWQLANKTGLKRPTVYLDLESLRRKKLAGLLPKGDKTIYVPESPSRLSSLVHEQQGILHEVMPFLRALENKAGQKPVIRYYDQMSDIIHVWRHEMWAAKENWYMSHVSLLLQNFPELMREYSELVEHGLQVRELVTVNPGDITYAKKSHPTHHRIRILPSTTEFNIDVELWDETMALYSYTKTSLLVITDPAIANAFRALYEIVWSASRDPKTLAKKG